MTAIKKTPKIPFPIQPDYDSLFKLYPDECWNHLNKDVLVSLAKKHHLPCKSRDKRDKVLHEVKEYYKRHSIREVVSHLKTATVPTYVLEDMLGKLTKTQRDNLVTGGFIPVLSITSIRKYGKNLETPNYSFFGLLNVHAHKSQLSDALSYGRFCRLQSPEHAEALKVAREYNQERRAKKRQQREQVTTEIQNQLTSFGNPGTLHFYVFQLAFWCRQINHLAKTVLHPDKASELYALKDQALQLFFKYVDQSYISVFIYRPEQPDKIDFRLCPDHFEKFCEERSWHEGERAIDYLGIHQHAIKKCADCSLQVQKEYYTLYYFQISDGTSEYGFHLPYMKNKAIFGNRRKYSEVDHKENVEGSFRFGRAITKDELALIGNKEHIIAEFKRAYHSLATFYENTTNLPIAK